MLEQLAAEIEDAAGHWTRMFAPEIAYRLRVCAMTLRELAAKFEKENER